MHNHTEKEIVNVKDMFQTIEMIEKILDDEGTKKKFPFEVKIDRKGEKGAGKSVTKFLDDTQEDNEVKKYTTGTFPAQPNNDDELLLAMFGEKK